MKTKRNKKENVKTVKFRTENEIYTLRSCTIKSFIAMKKEIFSTSVFSAIRYGE
ncbi:MAG: hypothetical protein AMDU4_FER2C00182G0004 [Ferroplasma sp. Type II]|jgi:hypothetical protein|uniref:hypothetical protein n=1 Tax=Ferroplasma sp. Type II TaxID=261388 RepID=UPI00038954A2|nr:hypothetical protein [Ferroplasma sp. Type II]EQB71571.1 MAG: hypothetical protein AMDU4_FER2C00182G0004 [Ferroplasma sp. Type II]HII82402.1 hypothetical protein [Ferroplasma sp.]